MLLREVLLLSGERTGMRRGRDHGGLFDPVAARRLAAAETPTPLGTHVQRGQAGKVGPRRDLTSRPRQRLASANFLFYFLKLTVAQTDLM